MKNYTLYALFMAIVTVGFTQTDRRLKGIEKDIEKILEVTQAPGLSVAIVVGDKTIYAKGFGYRNLEEQTKMNEHTLLPIASVTKAFTAGLLGQLRAENKLSFYDSPIDYVRELRFYNDELNNGVNIRDLMCHQTGIPRHGHSCILFPTSIKDSIIQRIQYMEPFTGLRQQWYYNNFMYLLQGVIAERITGKSWEANINNRIFTPLNFKRTNLSIVALKQSTNKAVGYELYNDSISRSLAYDATVMSPAGGINSSAIELAEWLKLWINDGRYKGKQILPSDFVREAISSQSIITPYLPSDGNSDRYFLNYGYGWMMTSYKGHYQVFHGGNLEGFTADVTFFPSDKIGIVVLTNQSNSALPDMVRNTIADRMLGKKKVDWTADFIAAKKARMKAYRKPITKESEITIPSHKLAEYKGTYYFPGSGRFTITQKQDSLFANFPSKKFYLKHVHYDVFQPIEVTKYGIDTTHLRPLKFNFITDESGAVFSVKMRLEEALNHPIEFLKE